MLQLLRYLYIIWFMHMSLWFMHLSLYISDQTNTTWSGQRENGFSKSIKSFKSIKRIKSFLLMLSPLSHTQALTFYNVHTSLQKILLAMDLFPALLRFQILLVWTPKFVTSVVKMKILANSTFIYAHLAIVVHRRHKFRGPIVVVPRQLLCRKQQ